MEKNSDGSSSTSMKQALWINLGWSFLMLVWFVYLAVGRYSNPRGVMLVLAAVYVIVSILALRQQRWAVGVSVVVAVIQMIRWLPMVAVNFWMLITRHELYQASPATIIIVAVYALVFAVPATLLCAFYFVKRRGLRLLLQPGRSVEA